MRIVLNRYFMDSSVTKSVMTVWMGDCESPALVCEAREPMYLNYSVDETFHGWTSFCLPRGRFVVGVRATDISPLTVAVGRSRHSCHTFVAYSNKQMPLARRVLIGEGDEAVCPEDRPLLAQKETFERFTRLVRYAYANEEKIEFEVE